MITALLVAALGTQAGTRLETKDVERFFGRYCVDCHSAVKPKKGFRLDRLPTTPEIWGVIHDRIRRGEMPPPKKKKQPTAAERRTVLRAIATRADAGRDGRTVFRRLNRAEYQNTLRDLLGVDLDLSERLPSDASAHGFDNVGEALHASSFLMDLCFSCVEKRPL